jgi:hypothetical protein
VASVLQRSDFPLQAFDGRVELRDLVNRSRLFFIGHERITKVSASFRIGGECAQLFWCQPMRLFWRVEYALAALPLTFSPLGRTYYLVCR